MTKLIKILLTLSAIALISACSSSADDDDLETTYAYFKFYNASANAGTSQLYLDDVLLASSNFSSSYANYTLLEDTYAFELTRINVNGEQETVISDELALEKGTSDLVIMVGDYAVPELIQLTYDYSDLEDLRLEEDEEGDEQFELYVTHVASDQPQYDIYMSLEEESFTQASLISSLDYKSVSDKKILIQDTYKVYLTPTGTQDIVFESPGIYLGFLDTFVLAIRENFGTSELAIDRLSGFSGVTSYVNTLSESQVKFYQSINDIGNIDIYLGDTDSELVAENISADQLTEERQLEQGAYSFTATLAFEPAQLILKNNLLNLNYGESKILLLYQDDMDEYQSISLDKQTRPLAYDNALTVVNLAPEFSAINVYFVATDENLETASNQVRELDFADSEQLILLQKEYQIFVTSEPDNGNQQLLYQAPSMTLDANINYLLIVEPDDNEFSGYRLSIVAE